MSKVEDVIDRLDRRPTRIERIKFKAALLSSSAFFFSLVGAMLYGVGWFLYLDAKAIYYHQPDPIDRLFDFIVRHL